MDITTELLQGFLDDAWDAAPANANTLRDQLRSFEKSVTSLFSKGTLGSVSKSSASQSYMRADLGAYTPAQIQTAWRSLINLFDDRQRWVIWAIAHPPTNPPTWWPTQPADGDQDTNVYNAMKWTLQPISEYQIDLTDLRLRPTITEGTVVTW